MNLFKSLTRIIFFFTILSNGTVAQVPQEVFVSSRGTNSVKVYDESGTYIKDFVTSGSGGLSVTEDILFHPDGSVLVTGYGNTTIKKYDGLTGAYLGDFSSGYTLNSPSKMSIGPDSLIYVTQWGTTQNKVVRFSLSGTFVDEFTNIGVPNGLGHIWDNKHNFYIALYNNGANGTVHKFDSTGNSVGTFVNTTILQGPTGIWFDKTGDMLVEDWTSGTVLRYDSAGNFEGIFLSGMTNPEGITFLSNGDMLIGDWGQDVVHQFDSLGGYVGVFASGSGLIDPNSVKTRNSRNVSVEEIGDSAIQFHAFADVENNNLHLDINMTKSSHVTVELFDNSGRLVESVHEGFMPVGINKLSWNYGNNIAASTYHVTMNSNGLKLTKTILLK